jgi:hypothetical protein
MVGKLSAREVQTERRPGRYGDGGGLWLQVGPTGGKAWLFRYKINGRERWMGLGPVEPVPLAEAREKAHEARRALLDKLDPLAARGTAREQARILAAQSMTFAQCAERMIASHEAGWRNPKHRAQWRSTLATYACPFLASFLSLPSIPGS